MAHKNRAKAIDKRYTTRYNSSEVMSVPDVFGFRLPNDLRKYLKAQAERQRTSIGHYIVMLIDKDMKEKDEKRNGEEKQSI